MTPTRGEVNVTDIDRRTLLATTGSALLAMSTTAGAGENPPAADAKKLSELITDFVVGFDLKSAPPLALERARLAFTDTMGVMLAGSREKVAELACEMVKAEGAAPAASVVGQSFRTSLQLAALPNGVPAPAMAYD